MTDEPNELPNDAPAENTPPPEAPAPSAAPAEPTTPLDGATPPAEAAKGYFDTAPDDWRSQLAGGDDKRAKELERVPDIKVLAQRFFDGQDKIRAGELASGLPENPTDEQMADWRIANGVPEDLDGYAQALGEGVQLAEDDTRIMDGVFEVAHKYNMSTDAVSEITNALLKGRDAEADAVVAEDGVHFQTTSRQLKDTWGGDFEANLNMIKGLTSQLPEGVREEFQSARLQNGQALFNSAEVNVWFADIARQLNPAGVVVPNAANPVQSIKNEIADLEAQMGDTVAWSKNTEGNDRLMALYEAEENMAK